MKQSHTNITGSRHAYLAPLGKRRLEVNLECHTPAYCPLSTRLVHPARPEHAEARKSRLRCLPEHRQSLEGIDEHRSRHTNRRHTLRQKRGETRHDDKTGLDTTTKAIARLPSHGLGIYGFICASDLTTDQIRDPFLLSCILSFPSFRLENSASLNPSMLVHASRSINSPPRPPPRLVGSSSPLR